MYQHKNWSVVLCETARQCMQRFIVIESWAFILGIASNRQHKVLNVYKYNPVRELVQDLLISEYSDIH